MADVNFTIGGSAAPFKSAMQEVTQSAKESAAKVTESFGVEGVKSERALHGKLQSAFADLTKSGTNSAEAIGGAFTNLTEGLKLSMGSMIALLAVSELVKSFYAGYQAAEKMKTSVKDALSINSDVTHQSVEQVQDDIKRLKDDADANNLASMSALQAGATAVVQAFEEGKSISEVVKEDAEEYNRLKQEAHDMEDELATKSIDNENAILQLKVEGMDSEVEGLEKLQKMEEDLAKANAAHNDREIAALHEKQDLEDQLADKKIAAAARERDAKLDDTRMEIAEEQANRGTDADKLKFAHQQEEKAKTGFGDANTKATDPLDIEKKRLEWEKSITKEKNLQKEISDKQIKAFLDGNEKDAEHYKKQQEAAQKKLEAEEKRTKLLQEQKEAQQAVTAAVLDSTLFHGEASSLAKVGLGGRVSGANYGNQAQLKAAQDAAKHLAEINAELKKFSGAVGVAQ